MNMGLQTLQAPWPLPRSTAGKEQVYCQLAETPCGEVSVSVRKKSEGKRKILEEKFPIEKLGIDVMV